MSSAPTGYSSLQIGLHWGIAALVLFQLIFGESMVAVVEAAEEGEAASSMDQLLGSAHYWVGISILALVVLRVAIRVLRGAPAHVTGTGRLTGLASSGLHALFYVLLFAVPVTGLLAVYVGDSFGEIHAIAKPAFIVLIVLHALAALYHHFVLRDATLRRMLVPGTNS